MKCAFLLLLLLTHSLYAESGQETFVNIPLKHNGQKQESYEHLPIYTPTNTDQLITVSDFTDTLSGSTISLEKIQPKHRDDYFAMLSPEVQTHVLVEGNLDDMFDDVLVDMSNGTEISYVIYNNADNTLIGEVALYANGPEYGQFVWWVNEAYQGGGRAREAAQLLIKEYFLRMPNASFVSAYVNPDNKKSLYALQGCGFKLVARTLSSKAAEKGFLVLEKTRE
jgi:RimJ/RimL family protein N-acetyltransferase